MIIAVFQVYRLDRRKHFVIFMFKDLSNLRLYYIAHLKIARSQYANVCHSRFAVTRTRERSEWERQKCRENRARQKGDKREEETWWRHQIKGADKKEQMQGSIFPREARTVRQSHEKNPQRTKIRRWLSLPASLWIKYLLILPIKVS